MFLQYWMGIGDSPEVRAIHAIESHPFASAVHGELVRDGKALQVAGSAWFDREWGTAVLGADEAGGIGSRCSFPMAGTYVLFVAPPRWPPGSAKQRGHLVGPNGQRARTRKR